MVEEKSEGEKRVEVVKMCDSLVAREVVSVAPIAWNGELGEDEVRALDRAGFLIDQYEMNFWWFEGLEMFRKLLLTTLLVSPFLSHTQGGERGRRHVSWENVHHLPATRAAANHIYRRTSSATSTRHPKSPESDAGAPSSIPIKKSLTPLLITGSVCSTKCRGVRILPVFPDRGSSPDEHKALETFTTIPKVVRSTPAPTPVPAVLINISSQTPTPVIPAIPLTVSALESFNTFKEMA